MKWIYWCVGSLFAVAAVAFAAASGDRLKSPVKIGQSTNVAESLAFDQGLGVSGSAMQVGVGGALAITSGAQSQANFNGWSDIGGSATSEGQITFGDQSTVQGKIQYSYSPATLYIDNARDSTSSAINFRMRTAGSAISPLIIGGDSTSIFNAAGNYQARFDGYSDDGGANVANGEIQIGNQSTGQGILQYTFSGTTFYVDNTRDATTANIKFRLRTSGSPVTALELDGTGASIFGGNVTINGTGGNTPHGCVVRSTTATNTVLDAVCSAGEIATGGGCATNSVSQQIFKTLPAGGSPPTQWACEATASTSLTAYAVCCQY